MKTRHLIFLLPLLLLLQSGCEEQEPQILIDETVDISDPVVQHILSRGIDLEDIREYDDFYLAEGDIKYDKNMQLPSGGPQTEHYRFPYIVSPGNRDISIFLDLNSFALTGEDLSHGAVDVKPVLSPALDQAIAAYNNLNADLRFTRALNPFSADIIVRKVSAYYEPFACGYAPEPGADGLVGDLIEIFPLPTHNTVSKMTQTLAHEIGHTLGFRHTYPAGESGPAPIYIPTTLNFDNASVMNGGCGDNWNGFSAGDIHAIECLYSFNPNSPCTPPVPPGPCTAPAAPSSISFTTDNQNYLFANAFLGRRLGIPDGYEWEILGGYINGGYNTNQLSIVPYCDDPATPGRTLYVSVRVYNLADDGGKCYSDWRTVSYVHSGRCYLIFN